MGTKNQTAVATQTPPSWVSDAYKSIFGTAGQIASKPYSPYTGGFTQDQQSAFKNIAGLWGASDPTFQSANSAVTSAMAPAWSTYSNYMNPYVDDVVKKTMASLNEQNGQQQQQVVGNAISKGAWGGDRVGVAQAELARQQALTNNQTISGLYSDAFKQAMQAAQQQQQTGLQGASALANIGQAQMNTNLAQTAAQLGAGTQQQQFDYSQYLNKQGYPYQQASWLASLIGGIGPLAGGTTTSVTPNGNLLSQLLGAGLGIAGLFKDGGVVPYRASEDSPWQPINLSDSPYSAASDTFTGYIPKVDMAGPRANFPSEIKPEKQDDPFDLSHPTSLMKTGASNFADWFGFADGGKVHFSDLGRPQSTNIEDRRNWANGDDPLGDLIRELNTPKKRRFAVPYDLNISEFDPFAPIPEEQQDHFADQYADGGVIPHMASGGYPQFSPGYSPSNFYTGSMAPPTPSGGHLYSSSAAPVFDAQNDPRFPVSPGFIPGTWTNPNKPTSWSPSSPDVSSYYDGVTVSPAVKAIQDAANGVPLPRSDPRGYLSFDNVPANNYDLGTAGGVIPGPGYGPPPKAPAQASTTPARPPGVLGRLFGLTGGNSPMDRILGINGGSGLFKGFGGLFNSASVPAMAQASALTGATPRVPYHSKPITHDFAPVKRAGERTDVFGRDMAFLPTSVQTSSRWNTGYAHGGVVPHMANGGLPFDSIWPSNFPDEEEAKRIGAAHRAELAQAAAAAPAADEGIMHPDDMNAYAAAPVPPGDYGSNAGVVPLPGPSYGDGPTPFAQGDQFLTKPNPEYSQNIGDVFHSLAAGKGLNLDPVARQALLAAGLGMMASKSPFFLQGVGEGGLKGIETWAGRTNQERENAKARADLTKTGTADIPLTQAQAGLTQASTGATRFTFNRSQAGVMVTDALNPGAPPRFVPWGGILPDGTIADKDKMGGGNGAEAGPTPLFTTEPLRVFDPRLMTPESAAGANAESLQAITDARADNQAAQSANQLFEEIHGDLAALPEDGFMTPGTGFSERLKTARAINTGLSVLGLAPALSENEIAAGEDFKKLTFRLGGELAKSYGATAASIITDSAEATPSGDLTPKGADRVLRGLEAMNRRKIDYYTALQNWQAANGGSSYGFDQYFNSVNPPELYALSAVVPRAALEYLQSHPEFASDFNAKYGNGRDVAQYVLRR